MPVVIIAADIMCRQRTRQALSLKSVQAAQEQFRCSWRQRSEMLNPDNSHAHLVKSWYIVVHVRSTLGSLLHNNEK